MMKSPEYSDLRYRRLLDTTPDGILILDAETGAIRDVNPYLIHLLGYSREEFLEKKLWEIGAFKEFDSNRDTFAVLQENENIRYEDLPLRAKDGSLIRVDFVSSTYFVDFEKIIQCNLRDITEHKQTEDALIKSQALLRQQSVRDSLTGLFNRGYMEETLERELLRASRKQLYLSIIMLDVDDFMVYNETWGHLAGDVVLHEIGTVLLDSVRKTDIASRFGGDEFIIVMPDATREITRARAEHIRENIHHLSIPFKGKMIEGITISMGVSVFPCDGSDSETIFKAADDALYRARLEGCDRVAVANIDSYLVNWDTC
jgi:diguanylate cyclase (GGDEF)-like protein/PAS domain S-box-containing protein